MAQLQRITPFLWFDTQAEDAAKFYTSVFKNSRIIRVSKYPNAGQEQHHMPAGSTMTVDFEIEGQRFTAMNAGPVFKFTEAVSFVVHCQNQEEIDYFWEKLTAGGGAPSECGWLKDRYGLSWQVTPEILLDMINDKDEAARTRAFSAMMTMKKIDIAELKRAFAGEAVRA
jgi:predicted 3-demethylubiquinone-9 3-methyltransferase (glyoxalase superfamily)